MRFGVLSLFVAFVLSGCNALDPARLGSFQPPGEDIPDPPDAGLALDGSMPVDSSVPPLDSSTPSLDGDTPMMDATAIDDAAAEAGEDAAIDVCDGSLCVDLCPSDPAKTDPGACGCGVHETYAAECTALQDALRHRYRFDGTGATAADDIGGEDGDIINATLSGDSTLELAGGTTDQYVELPPGIISALNDATFEAWVVWQGGNFWQRIFDFGSSSGTNGETYVFVTPQRGGSPEPMRAIFSLAGTGTEVAVDGTTALTAATLHHVVLVIDDLVEMRLYLDGVLQNSVPNPTRSLGDLDDVQNWLGRSQYSVDDEFSGTFYEFRIYDAALTTEEVAASAALGPDPAFLD